MVFGPHVQRCNARDAAAGPRRRARTSMWPLALHRRYRKGNSWTRHRHRCDYAADHCASGTAGCGLVGARALVSQFRYRCLVSLVRSGSSSHHRTTFRTHRHRRRGCRVTRKRSFTAWNAWKSSSRRTRPPWPCSARRGPRFVLGSRPTGRPFSGAVSGDRALDGHRSRRRCALVPRCLEAHGGRLGRGSLG